LLDFVLPVPAVTQRGLIERERGKDVKTPALMVAVSFLFWAGRQYEKNKYVG